MVDGVGTTHDVKIGDYHYLVRPGSYRKRGAQQFGPRFTTGDPDYNNLSAWQHWVQRCWVGGAGADEWKDDAMFDEGVGVDASQHEVMMLSRDLATDGGHTLEAGEKEFRVYNGTLYCMRMGANAKVWRFDPVTAFTLIKTFTHEVWGWAYHAGSLMFVGSGANIVAMSGAAGAEIFGDIPKPAGLTGTTAHWCAAYRDKLYVGLGRQIWRLTSTGSWDGSTAFYNADSITYLWRSAVHQGFLYMASENNVILRTDGNNTFEMFTFDEAPGQIDGLCSFDGRLFISAYEQLGATQGMQAVLYQLSGAALTELKRWAWSGYNVRPGFLRAFNGSLWFGASSLMGEGQQHGFGIMRYDPREDGYHLFASNMDDVTYAPGALAANNVVMDVIYWLGSIFCATYGHGVFVTPWTHRDASRYLATYDTTTAGVSVDSKNGGWYTSSDFDAGTPGLQKIWNAFVISIDLPAPACSAFVEYSLDGGTTWVEAGSITTLAAARLDAEIILGDGVTEVRGSRFKYRITLRTTDEMYSPFLRGVAVRYLPVPEPNWQWDMTLVLSESQALHDGTTQSPDNVLKMASLRDAFRTQSLIHFQDHDLAEYADGGSPGVIIQHMEEMVPVLGASSAGAREYEVRLTLLEMVEAYEAV